MSELVYRNGFGFMIGTGFGFGLSNSFRMLDQSDKMPEDAEYSSSYPVGVAGATEAVNDYIEIDSGTPFFEALSDDPGFIAGTALGVYLGEKYFKTSSYNSELEELYKENGLDDVWSDLEYY